MSQEQDRQHFVPFYVQQHLSRIREGMWDDRWDDRLSPTPNLIFVLEQGQKFCPTIVTMQIFSRQKKEQMSHIWWVDTL